VTPPADASGDVLVQQGPATLAPLFSTTTRAACEFSSPIAITSNGQKQIMIVTADGVFTALDRMTGAEVWRLALTAPTGLYVDLVAPPAVVGNLLVFAWQNASAAWTRADHHVGVIDLDARAFDPGFAPLTLTGYRPIFDGSDVVVFQPSHAFSRSAIVAARLPGRELGLVYVSFGNVRDLQPWHGWVFEIDLDAWKSQGPAAGADQGALLQAAVTGLLVTTATGNTQCGPVDGDGAREMLCGGGVWAHEGPELVYDDAAPDGFRLFVPVGNGMLDPIHKQYANTVISVGHGLNFDPQCDAIVCDPFDSASPSDACAKSCANLSIPRLLPGQFVPRGANDACVGKTLFQCWSSLDWDLGASAPAYVALPGGPRVIVQPGKDGSVYLFDADHLGTLYDRVPIMEGCGEGAGTCLADWAGTIVTKPVIVTVDGAVLALVSTFVFDNVHRAALQALEIRLDGAGQPHLIPRWQAPSFAGAESLSAFRRHPSGLTVASVGGEPYAALVDTGPPGSQMGKLYWIRVRDGQIVQRVPLAGPGQRFAPPLIADGVVYVPSCDRVGTPSFYEGPSHLEAMRIISP
jgi:hypothetical protein